MTLLSLHDYNTHDIIKNFLLIVIIYKFYHKTHHVSTMSHKLFPQNIYYLSRYGQKHLYDVDVKDVDKDYYFVLGKESTGIPYEILQEIATDLNFKVVKNCSHTEIDEAFLEIEKVICNISS